MNNNHLVNIVAHSEPYRRGIPQSDPRVLAALQRADRAAFVPDIPMEIHEVEKRRIDQATDLFNQFSAVVRGRDIFAAMRDPETQSVFSELLSVVGCVVRTAESLIVSSRAFAYNDTTLPIGYEQNCSQPSVVAIMAELLELQEGMRVL